MENEVIKLESGLVNVVLPKNDLNIDIMKSILEAMKSGPSVNLRTENDSNRIIQSVFKKALEEEPLRCEKCGKVIEKSVDEDFPLCKDCFNEIEERFRMYKDWGELNREGKRYRIKKSKEEEKEHVKLVYNPEKDPIITAVG